MTSKLLLRKHQTLVQSICAGTGFELPGQPRLLYTRTYCVAVYLCTCLPSNTSPFNCSNSALNEMAFSKTTMSKQTWSLSEMLITWQISSAYTASTIQCETWWGCMRPTQDDAKVELAVGLQMAAYTHTKSFSQPSGVFWPMAEVVNLGTSLQAHCWCSFSPAACHPVGILWIRILQPQTLWFSLQRLTNMCLQNTIHIQ